MKTILNGKVYDPGVDEELAVTKSANDYHKLRRTADGDFYVELEHVWLDGRKLRDDEWLLNLAPWYDRDTRQRERRVRIEIELVPLTPSAALAWCVRTQIPPCFSGGVFYLMPQKGVAA